MSDKDARVAPEMMSEAENRSGLADREDTAMRPDGQTRGKPDHFKQRKDAAPQVEGTASAPAYQSATPAAAAPSSSPVNPGTTPTERKPSAEASGKPGTEARHASDGPSQRSAALYEAARFLEGEARACEAGSPAELQNWPFVLTTMAGKLRALASTPGPNGKGMDAVLRDSADLAWRLEEAMKVIREFPGIRLEGDYNKWLFKRDRVLALGPMPACYATSQISEGSKS